MKWYLGKILDPPVLALAVHVQASKAARAAETAYW